MSSATRPESPATPTTKVGGTSLASAGIEDGIIADNAARTLAQGAVGELSEAARTAKYVSYSRMDCHRPVSENPFPYHHQTSQKNTIYI